MRNLRLSSKLWAYCCRTATSHRVQATTRFIKTLSLCNKVGLVSKVQERKNLVNQNVVTRICMNKSHKIYIMV
jgi:hypothetical protein